MTFERDPDAWPVVERILTLRRQGEPTPRIAAALNAEGVSTPTAAEARHVGSWLVPGGGTPLRWRSSAGAPTSSGPPRPLRSAKKPTEENRFRFGWGRDQRGAAPSPEAKNKVVRSP